MHNKNKYDCFKYGLASVSKYESRHNKLRWEEKNYFRGSNLRYKKPKYDDKHNQDPSQELIELLHSCLVVIQSMLKCLAIFVDFYLQMKNIGEKGDREWEFQEIQRKKFLKSDKYPCFDTNAARNTNQGLCIVKWHFNMDFFEAEKHKTLSQNKLNRLWTSS